MDWRTEFRFLAGIGPSALRTAISQRVQRTKLVPDSEANFQLRPELSLRMSDSLACTKGWIYLRVFQTAAITCLQFGNLICSSPHPTNKLIHIPRINRWKGKHVPCSGAASTEQPILCMLLFSCFIMQDTSILPWNSEITALKVRYSISVI